MAGVRQHILPKFLLKGFSSRVRDEQAFTWVFRKVGEPFETNIENVSVEKHFYGKQGELSADEEITNLESNFADLVIELRGKTDETRVSDSRISEFISHLVFRTKQFRIFLADSTEHILAELNGYLSDSENIKKILFANPDWLKKQMDATFQMVEAPQWQKEMVRPLIDSMLPSLIDREKEAFQALVGNLIDEIKQIAPRVIKESHIRSLAEMPVSMPRSAEYSRLNWFVNNTKSSVVLGDVGCLFETLGTRRFKPLDDKDDEVVGIYLPVSSRQILYGVPYSYAPPIDLKTLNKAFARCSYEYFVSPDTLPEKIALIPLIGQWAGFLTKLEVEQLLAEIFRDLQAGSR